MDHLIENTFSYLYPERGEGINLGLRKGYLG